MNKIPTGKAQDYHSVINRCRKKEKSKSMKPYQNDERVTSPLLFAETTQLLCFITL